MKRYSFLGSFFVLLFLVGSIQILPIIERREISRLDSSPEKPILRSKAKRYEEKTIVYWWVTTLATKAVHEKGVIHLNITVLSCSNASVFFEDYTDSRYHWQPSVPENITLLPGTSFAETFTLESSAVDDLGGLFFEASTTIKGTNATVLWCYEIIKKGFNLPWPLPWVFGIGGSVLFVLVLLISIEVVRGRRKKAQKQKSKKAPIGEEADSRAVILLYRRLLKKNKKWSGG
ncbi:MAG: hypothetical protein GF308_18100 [Candidatus Heimdallarchaeota archaeon]|nr:hypothetical protein [Candidatus Heimdallarchaeota archaeon]